MTNEDKPRGGVRLDAAFGASSDAPQSPSAASDTPFRLLVVGDFGGSGDGRLIDVSSQDLTELLASFGATVELEAPNRPGSTPPALAVRLPIASLRDLDPKTLQARIPEVVDAERLIKALQEKRSIADLGPLASRPDLDQVVAALQSAPPISPPHASATLNGALPAENDEDSVDRLLGMIDAPTPNAPSPEVAKTAVSAFVSSLGKSRQPTSAPQAAAELLARQAREISEHPGWLRIEMAWRSLQLIFAARNSRKATRIELCDVRRPALIETLASEAFSEAADGLQLKAVLVLGAFGRSDKDLNDLDRLAQIAEGLAIPTVVSLDSEFFCAPPASVATMGNPGALLEGAGYAAWRGLRGRDESQSLFACWNDFVLRSDASAAPPLWGEAGAIAAAQILRSLARTGWPTEIIGAESALGGLDVVEVETRGARHSAIPLRALIDPGVARDLGRGGVICLVCRPDRDQAWLTRAPSLRAHGATPEVDRKVMEQFDSLSFRFVSTYFENLFRHNAASLSPPGADEAEVAASIARLANDALIATGPGAAADATPRARSAEEDESARCFDVSIRLGQDVMGGLAFAFDLTL